VDDLAVLAVSVNKFKLNQKGAPKSHRTTRQISRETGMHHPSVVHVVS